MGLSKTLIALGTWIDKRFPEKLTASVVSDTLAKIEYSISDIARRVQEVQELATATANRVGELEKKFDVVNSDMTKTKLMLMTQRQAAGR